jgi:hypothetical protein
MNESETRAYYQGVLDGLWRYAWMKDGTYYVGTTGKTLREAKDDVEKEFEKELAKLKS